VFGEGITNDAIGIILFNAVVKFAGPDSKRDWTTPFEIIWSFLVLGFWSLFIGIAIGFISALFFKYFRFLTVKPLVECNIVFFFGYLSYTISERFEMSGIISLLAAGILMSKYCWFNLSP
jgi:NhaP-type Na+/H+ or K+/H+ antiporter